MTMILRKFKTLATAYHPTESATGSAENRLEGGPHDRRDFPLMFDYKTSEGFMRRGRFTLEEFLAGRASYVACAMDCYPQGPRYATMMRCPELEKQLNQGRPIPLMVVDTGGDFTGKGMMRIDICCSNQKYGDQIIGKNRPLTLIVFANAEDPFMQVGEEL